MSLFHEHTWSVESINYTPPNSSGFKAQNATPEIVRDLTEGVTHVHMRCIKCSDLQERRVNGKYGCSDE